MKNFYFRFYAMFIFGMLFLNPKAAFSSDEYETARKKVQYYSYYDSANTFNYGKVAIQIALKENNPVLESEILIHYGNLYFFRGDFERAKYYLDKAYVIAKKYNHVRFMSQSKIRLMGILAETGFRDEARKVYREIIVSSRKNNDAASQIEALNALGLLEQRYNDYTLSMALLLEALKIAEENNNDFYISATLNNIGNIKLYNLQNKEARKDFDRALKLAIKVDNPRLITALYNNIALIDMDEGNIDAAIRQYEAIMLYSNRSGNQEEIGVTCINMSLSYILKEEYDVALAYTDTAIRALRANHNVFPLSKALLEKSQILKKKKNYADALSISKEVEVLADTNKILEVAVGVHQMLSDIYDLTGNSAKALTEYKLFKELNDSLNKIKNLESISELQVKYDVENQQLKLEKEQNRSLILEQENKLGRQARNLFIAIASLVIIVISVVFYSRYNRIKRQQQEMVSQQLIGLLEEERSRVSKDLHDDIGQSLSAIKLRVSAINSTNENLGNIETGISDVVEQIRRISRGLYPSYIEKIGLRKSIEELIRLTQENTKMVCSTEIDKNVDDLPAATRTHVYRIVQECVNNTIKHSGADAMKVEISKSKNQFKLTYQDNGKGVGKSLSKLNGIGFMSIKERAKIIHGDLLLGEATPRGFRLQLKFENETKIA